MPTWMEMVELETQTLTQPIKPIKHGKINGLLTTYTLKKAIKHGKISLWRFKQGKLICNWQHIKLKISDLWVLCEFEKLEDF